MEAFVLSCGSRGTGKIYLVESVYFPFIVTDVYVQIYIYLCYIHVKEVHSCAHEYAQGGLRLMLNASLLHSTYVHIWSLTEPGSCHFV